MSDRSKAYYIQLLVNLILYALIYVTFGFENAIMVLGIFLLTKLQLLERESEYTSKATELLVDFSGNVLDYLRNRK